MKNRELKIEIKVAMATNYSSTIYFNIFLFIPNFGGQNTILSQNDECLLVPIISFFSV